MTQSFRRRACLMGLAGLLAASWGLAVTSLVPAWKQTWSTTVTSGVGDPFVARTLDDDSMMVFASNGAIVRYDSNGSVLSAVVIAPPNFSPLTYGIPGGIRYASSAAIDGAGSVFVATVSDPSVYSRTANGWLLKYDGRTGESLWPFPAVLDAGFFYSTVPRQLLVGPDGNPVVIGHDGRGSGAFAAKVDAASGAPIWGPVVLVDGVSSPLGRLDGSGDLILAASRYSNDVSRFEVRVSKLSGQNGSFSWGPAVLSDPVHDSVLRRLEVGGNGDVFVLTDASANPPTRLWKIGGPSGSTIWTQDVGPAVSENLPDVGITPTPAGDVLFRLSHVDRVTLEQRSGADGSLVWGPVDLSVAGEQYQTGQVEITPDGGILLAVQAYSPAVPSQQLELWKRASNGAPIWGPIALAGSSQSRPPFTLHADGQVRVATSVAGDMKTSAFVVGTGVSAWGPVGFSANFPVLGIVDDLTQGPDGSVFVTGHARFPTEIRWVTLKYDRATGAVLWGPKYFAGGQPYNVRTDSSGNAFVTGVTDAGGIVVKYAAVDGNQLWQSVVYPNGNPQEIGVDANGDVGVAGWQDSSGGFAAAKVSGADGSILWGPIEYTPPQPLMAVFAKRIVVSASGDFVVSGYLFGNGYGPDGWVTFRYAGASGAIQWGPAILGDSQISGGYVYDVQMGTNGHPVVVGLSTVDNVYRLTTVEYDGATGVERWRAFAPNGNPYDWGFAAAIDAQNDAFVTGFMYNGVSYDFATLKYRGTDGSLVWGPRLYDGTVSGWDQSFGIALDGSGNPFVVGVSPNEWGTKNVVVTGYDGSTGISLGPPAVLDGWQGHSLELLMIFARGSSIVVSATGQSFETVAWNEVAGLQCDPSFPAPVATVASGAACDGQTVQLSASFYESASYAWSGPNGFTSTLRNPTLTATPAAGGTYSVVVQAYGCPLPVATTSLVVHPPISAAITASVTQGTASVPDAGPGASYFWSLNNAIIPNSQGRSSIQFQPNSSGVLRVTVANHDGCQAASALALFSDVPSGSPMSPFITRLVVDGVSAGCGPNTFCPNDPVTRAQMAVFLLRSKNGPSYNPPPATGTVFTDVSASSFAAAWIEALAASGVTSGCGGGNYCPTEPVSRAQMAVFLLRTLHGSSFTPPPATGTVFSDVPASAFAAAWIERLAAEGLTAGCGPGIFCPDASVSRGQMAVFLVQTFSLP